MKKQLKRFAPAMLGLFLIAAAGSLEAQTTDTVLAHVNHSFMIGDKALPPGNYSFKMTPDSTLGAMVAQNGSGKSVAQFTVRQSVNNRAPKHTELTFRKYGNTEFLSKVYESGRTNGVVVTESSREEKKLIDSGQQATEHTEEQP